MNISDIASSLYASLGTASFGQTERARSTSDAVSAAFSRANDRLEQQQSSTQVSLSAFGQIRSAVDQLQASSDALTNGENTDTDEEALQATRDFVNAFNNARTATNRTINGEGNAEDRTSGALADDSRARIAASELSRTLDRNSSNALREIGISTNQDGTLRIDEQRFQQALQDNRQNVTSTLADTGRQVEQTTTQQAESTVNRSIANLNQQAQNLEAQQAQQQALIESQQRSVEDAGNRLNAIAASGIAAYQRIFGL